MCGPPPKGSESFSRDVDRAAVGADRHTVGVPPDFDRPGHRIARRADHHNATGVRDVGVLRFGWCRAEDYPDSD